jgi:hypothetical protein
MGRNNESATPTPVSNRIRYFTDRWGRGRKSSTADEAYRVDGDRILEHFKMDVWPG